MELGHRVDDFSFTIELRGSRPNCIADEKRWFALATALTTAWGSDGEMLAHLLEERIGYNKEGAVGFSYAEDADGSRNGTVRVFFMEDTLTLEQSFFEEAAVEFGLAALAALRRAALPAPDGLEARLRAVRARI